MDIYLILILIFGTVALLLLLLAAVFYRRDQIIKNKSTEKTTGKVVHYSWQSSRGPVVEYWVDGKSYKKALFYSYTSYRSRLNQSVQVSARDDLLDTRLRIRKNRIASINTLVKDRFPLSSEMTVCYNPENPNLSYVERYAPNYLWVIFLITGLIFTLIAGAFWMFG